MPEKCSEPESADGDSATCAKKEKIGLPSQPEDVDDARLRLRLDTVQRNLWVSVSLTRGDDSPVDRRDGAVFAHAEAAQQSHHRAPVRETRLEEVEADEGPEQQPLGAPPVRRKQTEQDEGAGNPSLDRHRGCSSAQEAIALYPEQGALPSER
jgi:hypothetical protein